jgi:excisionase family DNA binding protein
MNENDPLLTVPEFSSILRLKNSCTRRWIREGKVTTVHVGRLVRIPRSEATRIIREGTRQAKQK